MLIYCTFSPCNKCCPLTSKPLLMLFLLPPMLFLPLPPLDLANPYSSLRLLCRCHFLEKPSLTSLHPQSLGGAYSPGTPCWCSCAPTVNYCGDARGLGSTGAQGASSKCLDEWSPWKRSGMPLLPSAGILGGQAGDRGTGGAPLSPSSPQTLPLPNRAPPACPTPSLPPAQ